VQFDTLRGKHLVITGGFGVLGRTTAQLALLAGAEVALIDRVDSGGHDPAISLAFGDVDLTDEAAVGAVFSAISSQWSKIDGVFNIAGAFQWHRIAEAPLSLWREMFEANLLSAVNSTRAAMPFLRPGSVVVNIAAAAAQKGSVGMGPYTASKAGVLRFTESLAQELSSDGVLVYSVSPTILDTPRNRRDMPDADRIHWVAPQDVAKQLLALLEGKVPSGRDIAMGCLPSEAE
jgi:NAD(P)-dependent dehydrogenase (short-subunit alcohol dehydrogenase family)